MDVQTFNVSGLGWVDADPDINQIRIRFGDEHEQTTLIVSPAWLVGGLLTALRQAEVVVTAARTPDQPPTSAEAQE